MRTLVNFEDITNMAMMSKFCRLFNNITGLILDINNVDGTHPKKYYSNDEENMFCKIICNTEKGLKECLESGRKGGIRAGILRRPYIYQCHAGLIDICVPIFIKENHIATLTTGQILTMKPTRKKFKQIKKNVRDYGIYLDALKEAYFNTVVISKIIIMNYIELMNLIISYIFEVEDKIVMLKNNLSNPIVAKAILFIKKHYFDKIYIDDVAEYIYVSKYYLERLFKNETGFSFIEYLNLYRISIAKKKLLDHSISTACFESGFGSMSNFYKIFKRYVDESPKCYKKNLRYLLKV